MKLQWMIHLCKLLKCLLNFVNAKFCEWILIIQYFLAYWERSKVGLQSECLRVKCLTNDITTYFRATRPEAMDDEVTQILKKWSLNSKTNIESLNQSQKEAFDSRTYTRVKKRTSGMSDSERGAQPMETEVISRFSYSQPSGFSLKLLLERRN